jgi:hypothetical protein
MIKINFLFGRARKPDTGTLPGLLDVLSGESLLRTQTPILEKYCAPKPNIVVRVSGFVVVTVRRAEVIPIVVVPTTAAQNASMTVTSLVTQHHAFIELSWEGEAPAEPPLPFFR